MTNKKHSKTNQLIPIESVNALELFTKEGQLEDLLNKIGDYVVPIIFDTETAEGRKDCKALAYKIARSKTTIENAGKELVSDWKAKAKVVDLKRKQSRDFLTELQTTIRKPLTEYELEQERLAQAAAQKAEMEACELEAYAENELFDREAKVSETEARIAAEQAERDRIEAERKAEEDWLEVQESIRKEAAEAAKREAAEAIERAAKEKEEAERHAKEQAVRAEADRIVAAERAEREKQAAIEREQKRAKDEADRLEHERLRLVEEKEQETRRRAADKENQRSVNNAIVKALVKGGVTEKIAKAVVILIASGKVPSLSIQY